MPVRSLLRRLAAPLALAALGCATIMVGSFASTGTALAETISAGDAHSCAVRVSGAVVCWGNGARGELGNGDYEHKSTPVAVSGLTDVTAVSAGGGHTCAVRSTGEALCWGSGGEGEIGNGSKLTSPTPASVSGLTDAVGISAGARNTCAVRASGHVLCWGAGTEGQLGNGAKNDSATPVPVTGISDATSVTVGYDIACAVRGTGAVACWGNGSGGALGNGSDADASTPVAVSGITNARSASAGLGYVCAVRSSGSVACWGNGYYGQLGNGGTASSSTPVSVTGISEATAISAGAQVCAITESSAVFCWGPGPLGDHGTGGSSTPVFVTGNATGIGAGDGHVCAAQLSGEAVCWGRGPVGQLGNGKVSSSTTSVNVTGISDAMSVSAGAYQSCAVQSMNFATKTPGPVLCWGSGGANGHGVDRPTAVIVSGVLSATKVAAGSFHTCALRSNGQVTCWGTNDDGALGSGSLGASPTPVPVTGIADAVDVDAGGWLSCAVRSGGQVLCWGLNYGPTPVTISGISDAKSVAVGGAHACALRVTGQITCWGSGGAGQLGNGAFADSATPVPVSGITNATAVSAGGDGACARRATGEISCWGSGFLGDGTSFRSPFTFPPAVPAGSAIPVSVAGIADATTISVTDGPDDWFACATRATGQVLCWGGNSSGELGNGSLTTSTGPVPVSGIADAAGVGAGGGVVEYGGHACVTRIGGQVRCWGDGTFGQIGDGFMPFGHGPQVSPQAVVGLTDVAPDPGLIQPGTPDTTPPVITITTPTEGQHVEQGAAIQTDFTCTDPGGSGVETCDGPATLDTAAIGPKTLTITTNDKEGNQAAKTVTYIVDQKAVTQTPTTTDTTTTQVTPPPPPPFGATDSQILTALGSVLSPAGKAARIRALLKSGYTFTFKAPAAGKLQITWYYLPKGAKLAAKAKPIPLAAGSTTAAGAGAIKVKIKINAAGRKRLKNAKSLKITTKATFTPTGTKPLSTTKSITVKK